MLNKPRVVIDARMVGKVPHGFARYVSRLAEGLAAAKDASVPLAYDPVFLIQRGIRGTPEGRPFEPFECHESASAFLSLAEIHRLPRELRKLRASLYHSPTFSSLPYCPCPWLVTIHDLNHLSFGGWRERVYYQALLKRFARRARRLLTVSEFSRSQLARWLRCNPASICIVPNALSAQFFEPVPEMTMTAVLHRYGLSRGRYFFSLSNSKPHKNLPLLIDAYTAYRQPREADAWPLVLTARGLSAQEGVRQLGGVSDAEGLALLQGAGAMVFPSLYEGFGLPPVEAAAHGVKIAVSDISPHREALQDLSSEEALWVRPDDRDGWTGALAAIQDGRLAAPSAESTRKVRARYSVETLGQSMDAIYREALSGHSAGARKLRNPQET